MTTHYRPRTEGLFAEIHHLRDATNSYWEVHSKDGLKSFYGTEASFGNDPAAIADPSDRRKIFSWKLTRTEDPFGNRIEYEYERDTGEEGPHHWDQLYLAKIRYVDHGDDRAHPQFLIIVEFVYEKPDVPISGNRRSDQLRPRPDPYSEYRSGFEIRTRKRCTRIVVRTNAEIDQRVHLRSDLSRRAAGTHSLLAGKRCLNKFTNVDLYDWMGGVLERVYSFFLQQATSTARLAENQLAFERQEPPAAYIQSDYWQAPDDSLPTDNVQGAVINRRGLTGSARLLQDLYRLDQYSFDTNKRKLQLSKTISLALTAPTEFQRFREAGVMTFATPIGTFDRDFPRHYLRLIRSVRMSVVALIPPTQGIHATLSTAGVSRAVIGPDIFQTVPIRRDPELVALTSAMNASGVFELEAQASGMLLPFEGSGVDTTWELRMPKAGNYFDYRTIGDVLITIDYTALHSWDYSQQVIQSLRQSMSGDRPFSFRNQFADQWYDLHNPEQTSTPMTVRFTTMREDFPPNIAALKIQHVLLYFVRADATSVEVPVSHFRYTAQAELGTVGGSATSIDGIISTRRGNAGSWTAMIGKSPIGEWELTLPNTEEIRHRFGDEGSNEDIEDILFVITYSGRTPEWPA
jgi:Tc toxin complex TcA C-terminal TcB-binding domain/Salmonella virulence plasmid 65kDa B protein